MKATPKAAWLREFAKWLRRASTAPAILLGLSVASNIYVGPPVASAAAFAAAHWAPITVVIVCYVAFNAIARWLENKADFIRNGQIRRIVIAKKRKAAKARKLDSS